MTRTTVYGQKEGPSAAAKFSGECKVEKTTPTQASRDCPDTVRLDATVRDEFVAVDAHILQMQNIVYDDDRQIRQAEITHVELGAAFSIAGISKIIVDAIQANRPFVYVRIEDPVDPFPLPR